MERGDWDLGLLWPRRMIRVYPNRVGFGLSPPRYVPVISTPAAVVVLRRVANRAGHDQVSGSAL
jgi:hypothetical protein